MVSYEEWERAVPEHVQHGPIWSLRIYRTALYAGEIGRRDAASLAKEPEWADLADQLRRATGSISANIAEGYSRLGRRDRGKFYEYALGSARESRDSYYKARTPLGEHAATARFSLMTTLIKVLIVLISKSRLPVKPKIPSNP